MSESPILVVGLQRSGTSAVAGILHHLGLDLGVSPVSPNAEYFEDDALTQLCNRISGNWRCPQVHFLFDDGREQILRWQELRDRRVDGRAWAAKSPYFAVNLQHFFRVIRTPRVILTERAFESCVRSLVRREQVLPHAVAEQIQGQAFACKQALEQAMAASRVPAIRVEYDKLVESPAELVPHIAQFAGVDADLTPAIEFINPKLRHIHGN